MYVDANPPSAARQSHLCLCTSSRCTQWHKRSLPHPPAFSLCRVSQGSRHQVASRLSPLPGSNSVSAPAPRAAQQAQSRRGCAPLQPPRQVDTLYLLLIPPPLAAAAPAVPLPCILSFPPPAPLWACPRPETANSRPQRARRHRPFGSLCVCVHIAGLHFHSPGSTFHSFSLPLDPASTANPTTVQRVCSGASRLSPELVGVRLWEPNFRPRLLPCPCQAVLTVASCPA